MHSGSVNHADFWVSGRMERIEIFFASFQRPATEKDPVPEINEHICRTDFYSLFKDPEKVFKIEPPVTAFLINRSLRPCNTNGYFEPTLFRNAAMKRICKCCCGICHGVCSVGNSNRIITFVILSLLN